MLFGGWLSCFHDYGVWKIVEGRRCRLLRCVWDVYMVVGGNKVVVCMKVVLKIYVCVIELVCFSDFE